MKSTNNITISIYFLTVIACDDTPAKQISHIHPDKPILKKRVRPIHISHTTQTQSKTTKKPRKTPRPRPNPKRWTYNAKNCAIQLEQATHDIELTDPDDQLFLGSNGHISISTEAKISTSDTTLLPYKIAIQMPPKTLLGNITLETGDGCRNYRSALVYRIQRATYPKYTKHFIHYTKRPQWIRDYFYSVSDGDESLDPSTVKMTALYRKDFIVYEIDYSATRNKIKHRFRRALKSCFKSIHNSK